MSVYDSTLILIYLGTVAFLFGAVMGSFLNCAAYRISHGQSFLRGRSKCPECDHTLGVLDLFPIFSWLFLRGRCRYCKKKIPVRYFLTELFFAFVTLGALLRFDLTPICFRNYIFICCLFCLSLVDLESFIIPNGCIIISVAAWVLCLPFSGATLADAGLSVLAGVVYGGGLLLISLLLDKILHKESLGGGDVKLFFAVGLYTGLVGGMFALMLACVLGLVFALVRKKTKKGEEQVPFGPAIAASAALILFFGQPLINAYVSLLGF